MKVLQFPSIYKIEKLRSKWSITGTISSLNMKNSYHLTVLICGQRKDRIYFSYFMSLKRHALWKNIAIFQFIIIMLCIHAITKLDPIITNMCARPWDHDVFISASVYLIGGSFVPEELFVVLLSLVIFNHYYFTFHCQFCFVIKTHYTGVFKIFFRNMIDINGI